MWNWFGFADNRSCITPAAQIRPASQVSDIEDKLRDLASGLDTPVQLDSASESGAPGALPGHMYNNHTQGTANGGPMTSTPHMHNQYPGE